MAVWQLDFYIIPEEKINIDLPFNKKLNEKLLEWQDDRISKQSLDRLSKRLSIEKSWSNDITQYGKLESTCVEIATDIISIRIRLDFARLTKEIYEAVLSFIIDNKCVLYRIDTGEIYSGNRKGLAQLIFESRLFIIMRKSNTFLDELYKENI